MQDYATVTGLPVLAASSDPTFESKKPVTRPATTTCLCITVGGPRLFPNVNVLAGIVLKRKDRNVPGSSFSCASHQSGLRGKVIRSDGE